MADRRDDPADEAPMLDGASPPDAAVFAPTRLTLPRPARAGLAMAQAIVLAIGGLAAAGILGRHAPHTTSVALVDRSAFDVADGDAARETPWRTHPGTGEPFAEPLLAFRAQVSGRQLFVNGDVFTRDADVVLIMVGDLDRSMIELRSFELPGGSTAFRLGPNDRFDIAFGLDDWTTEVAWVSATAYDEAGNPLGSVRQSVAIASGHDRVPS